MASTTRLDDPDDWVRCWYCKSWIDKKTAARARIITCWRPWSYVCPDIIACMRLVLRNLRCPKKWWDVHG